MSSYTQSISKRSGGKSTLAFSTLYPAGFLKVTSLPFILKVTKESAWVSSWLAMGNAKWKSNPGVILCYDLSSLIFVIQEDPYGYDTYNTQQTNKQSWWY